jgi:hypothetical protein
MLGAIGGLDLYTAPEARGRLPKIAANSVMDAV